MLPVKLKFHFIVGTIDEILLKKVSSLFEICMNMFNRPFYLIVVGLIIQYLIGYFVTNAYIALYYL